MSSHESHLRDLDWAIGLNRRSLRLIGAWPEDAPNFDNKFAATTLSIPIMILIILFGQFLPSINALILVIHELPLVVNNLMVTGSAVTCCLKLYFIWHNSKVLQPVVQSLARDWLCYKCDWEMETMKMEANRARRFTIGSYIVMGLSWSGFAFAPFMNFETRPISNITDYGDRYLIFQAYYPYDYSKSPLFEMTQVLQAICGFIIALSLSIPDNYFGILIFHMSTQFKILGLKIDKLVQKDYSRRIAGNQDFKRQLSVLINRHVDLIKMVDILEYSFSFITFGQLLGVSVLFISAGFTVTDMFTNINSQFSSLQFVTQLLFLMNLNAHTFYICLACEVLKSCSSEVFHYVYKSQWYTIPHKRAQDLIPMMIISTNPRQIKAGYILQLSLVNYCSIMKSLLGYISVFIAING